MDKDTGEILEAADSVVLLDAAAVTEEEANVVWKLGNSESVVDVIVVV